MDVRIQTHAVERFMERCRPDLRAREAEQCMREMLSRAVHVKEKRTDGTSVWVCDGVRFVIKHDKGPGKTFENHRTFCLTVLPPVEDRQDDVDAESWQHRLPPDAEKAPSEDIEAMADLREPVNFLLPDEKLSELAKRMKRNARTLFKSYQEWEARARRSSKQGDEVAAKLAREEIQRMREKREKTLEIVVKLTQKRP